MEDKYEYLITRLGCTRSYTRREALRYEKAGYREKYTGPQAVILIEKTRITDNRSEIYSIAIFSL